jgi:hypothetical protein
VAGLTRYVLLYFHHRLSESWVLRPTAADPQRVTMEALTFGGHFVAKSVTNNASERVVNPKNEHSDSQRVP